MVLFNLSDIHTIYKLNQMTELYQHQIEGVNWMLGREHSVDGPKGGFLCDEMGLGKTAQLISVITRNHVPNTLVIVPKSIVTQWKNEVHKFAPELSVFVYDGMKRTKDSTEFKLYDVTVCPYSLLTEDIPLIHNIEWGRIILDEAHEIRNRRSKRFKSAMKLISTYRWIVTGTPVFNNVDDFVSLCTFIGIDRIDVQCHLEAIREKFILRRTKNKKDIPECHFENIELDMYPEEKDMYKHVFSEAQEMIRDMMKRASVHGNSTMYNMDILECFLRARQTMIWPQLYIDGMSKKMDEEMEPWTGRSKKMETLFQLIAQHPDEKTLIFCQFMGEMNYIQENLKCPVFRIDGSCSKERRESQLAEFKRAPQNSVFLIQVKAGGQGLNIQCASRVYITSPSWNPGTELQAIGRCHRSGQEREVYVKKLLYKGDGTYPSVDESIVALQVRKSYEYAEVLGDDSLKTQLPGKSEGLSISEIRNIFRA
jgi:SNF2 family DNA or RNA helicase